MRQILRVAVAAVLAGCATNEYTGRRQLMLVDEKTETQLGVTAYQEALSQGHVSTDPAEVQPVRRVGERIAQAANKPEFRWEFNTLVDDKTMNAWCLPGGKIAFYTGIFPVLEDEAGMAFVMGHEVGHALMHHGAERMSQNMVAGGAATLAGAALGATDTKNSEMVLAAFGALTNVGVLLPFSRKHESEADAIGLDLMAKAGYDPRAGVRVWKKMSELTGQQPPQWLSTHPSHETRIRDLEERMAAALAVYEKSTRAPVAKLPAISNRVPKKASEPAGAGLAAASDAVRVSVSPGRIETLQDGRRVARFEVTFSRDAFVRSVEVSSRNGRTVQELNTGVGGGDKKILTLPADLAQTGELSLIFHGTASGRTFRSGAEIRAN